MHAFLLLTLSLGQANPTLERAEREFAAGIADRAAGGTGRAHFRAAAEAYDEVRLAGADNVLLYRNQGNAYYLAGDLPRAILTYRLGLRLAPNDELLRAHLELARKRAGVESNPLGHPPEDVRPVFVPVIGRGGLFALAAAFSLAAWAMLARWAMVRTLWLLLVGLALLAVAAVLALWLTHQRDGVDRPIVVVARDGVVLRKGDGTTFPPRYEGVLNRGVEAELRHRRGHWVQIELARGEIGWVRADDVVIGAE